MAFLKAHQFIPAVTHFDFMRQRFVAFTVGGIFLLITIFSLATHGLNLGIDFRGGIVVEARQTNGAFDLADVRERVHALNLGDIELQQFGGDDTVMLRVQRQDGDEAAQMAAVDRIKATLGDSVEYRRIEVVGPRVGQELFHAGLTATLLAIIAISVYITARFEWQFGVAALISTFHDALVMMGIFSVLQLDFNLTAVAALLTFSGYSTNDTIVVFDRLRENLRRHKNANMKEIINDAVNQTLSRTIMTSVATLLALAPLLFWGGEALFGFALSVSLGIVFATYSSIYIASAILLYLPPVRSVAPVRQATA